MKINIFFKISMFLYINVFIFHLGSVAQKSKTDSLLILINNSDKDTVIINYYIELSKEFPKQDSSLFFLKKGIEIAKKNNYIKKNAEILKVIGDYYFEISDYTESFKSYLNSSNLFLKIADKKSASDCYNEIAKIKYFLKDYETSIDYIKKAIKLIGNNEKKKGQFYNNLAVLYSYLEDYGNSVLYYKESLSIKKKLKDSVGIANGYNNIGIVYRKTKSLYLALNFFRKSLDLNNKLLKKNKLKDISYISRTYGNLADLYIDFAQQEKSKTKKREYYFKSAKFGLKTLKNTETLHLPKLKEAVSLTLSKAYKGLGDYNQALKFYENHIYLKDSLFESSKIIEIQKIEYKFKINQQKQEYKNQIITKQLKNEKAKKLNYILGISFLSAILFIYFFSIRKHKKKNEKLYKLYSKTITQNKIIKENKEKYKFLVDNQSEGVIIVDKDENITFSNAASDKIFGLNTGELTGKNYKEFVDNQTFELIKKETKNRIKGIGNSYKIEIKDNKGIKKYLQLIVTPLIKDGKFEGSTAVVRDITEKRKIKKALEESEQKYRTLFNNSQDAILILENNKFSDCNQSAVKLFGYNSKKELINIHPSKISPEYQEDGTLSFEKAEEEINKAVKKGYNKFHWIHRKKNGNDFYAEVLLTMIQYKDGNVIHSVVRDISSEKNQK